MSFQGTIHPCRCGSASLRVTDHALDCPVRENYKPDKDDLEWSMKTDFINKFVETEIPPELMESAVEVLDVYIQAMNVFAERNKKYNDLWRRSGWLMNLVHIKHKADRLMRLFWGRIGKEQNAEPPEPEDAWDLMNYTTFFIITLKKGDARGHW